jgi:hypothetical protein
MKAGLESGAKPLDQLGLAVDRRVGSVTRDAAETGGSRAVEELEVRPSARWVGVGARTWPDESGERAECCEEA